MITRFVRRMIAATIRALNEANGCEILRVPQ